MLVWNIKYFSVVFTSFFLFVTLPLWYPVAAQSCPKTKYPDQPYCDSTVIQDITWGPVFLHSSYPQLPSGSDMWPSTWSDDGNIYTAWGDGGGFNGGTDTAFRVSLGFARIGGTPPDILGTNILGDSANSLNPISVDFGGKVWSIVSVDGTLYGWFCDSGGWHTWSCTGTAELIWSDDKGVTWQKSSDLASPWDFPSADFTPFGFVNRGKDPANASDGFVYFVLGSDLDNLHEYLGRAPKDSLTDKTTFEYLSGYDIADNPTWSSNEGDSVAIFSDPTNTVGIGGIYYNPVLNRYIAPSTINAQLGKLALFEAPQPWGPWSTIQANTNWSGFGAKKTVSLHIPIAWISPDGKDFWLVFSGLKADGLDGLNLVKGTFVLNPSPTPTSEPPVPGDTDGDRDVDIFDYNVVITDFGTSGSSAADFDGDHDVDIFDYNVVISNFGK